MFQGLDAWMLPRWEQQGVVDLDRMARIGVDLARRMLSPAD